VSSGYDHAYLVKNGSVVLYLAPVSEENVVIKSNLFIADRTRGKGTITKDARVDRHEITIQGEFVPTSDMQPDHKAAVQALFSRSAVTADQQFRWLMALKLHVGGQFDLYLGDDRYTATSAEQLVYDVDGCTLPQVAIDEVRKSKDSRKTRVGYTLKLIAGFERSTGEGA
jgi:hypothetical protein